MKCPLHCTCPGGKEGSSVAQAAGTTLGQRSIRWRQHWLQEMAVGSRGAHPPFDSFKGPSPFWICVTLVFSVAIGGNLSSFLSEKGNPSYHYRPQFHRVTIAALVIFMYAWLVPVGLWGFLTWRQGAERQIGGYSFLETVCVYGYSLFIYIPTSVLWIIPFEWLRWTLIVVAMVISGSVLVLTFWPVVREDTKVMAVATVVTIVVLHTLLAVGCKMYFFQTEVHVPSAAPITPTINMTIATKAH
ncbi:Yip1 member 1 [Dissostichus eleginoides]|nr:Yip1 member 1 [Dissostichus eleginoides]